MSGALDAWLELELEVPAELADDAAALLVAGGALGAQLFGTDEPASPPEEALPGGPSFQRTAHTPGHAVLVLSYPGGMSAHEAVEQAAAALAQIGLEQAAASALHRVRTDTDWAERWKQYFEPIAIGERLFVVPSWRRDEEPPPGALVLEIDPGMAFGTGQHATTALCLAELAGPTLLTNATKSLLDVGCGSGILAIAAAKLGVTDILAIDNDPDAVRATHENARLNAVDGRLVASAEPLGEVAKEFDVVVANILAVTLAQLAPELLRVTRRGGALLLSGVLAEQVLELEGALGQAAERASRTCVRERLTQRGDWVALSYRIG